MLSFVTPRRRLCRATGAAPTRWIVFAGLDVVRTEDGSFRVIEDQLRMPSGVAYAVAWRETLRDLLPVDPPQRDVSTVFGELALALRDAAPAGVDEPRVAILSEGPSAAAFWEHERLSRELCAALVTLDDLEHATVASWRGSMAVRERSTSSTCAPARIASLARTAPRRPSARRCSAPRPPAG
jgi:uncharacterized circularly permuted ATP-grasp superfamily protein